MSTDQSFIRAFRHDPPRTSAPSPAVSRPRSLQPVARTRATSAASAANAAASALWQSSVEIVAADSRWPELPAAAAPVAPKRAIGKRPLSAFTQSPTAPTAPAAPNETTNFFPHAEPSFRPETAVSGFRWPKVCRSLWEQYADQYEQIADLLLERAAADTSRGAIVGVTSLHPGDGATTTLLCLAVALAARDATNNLDDGNFRAPRLAGVLGVQPSTSWQDVLEHGLPVAEAVIRAENDGVDLLPLDARDQMGRAPQGAKLAAGLQTTITAGVLRYAYDLVLVDLGAVLAPRSFATVSHLIRNMRIDAAIAVADPKHAEPDDASIAGELLDETDCELLGLIENRTSMAH
jgi:Mrp family chromosome partitioning ATPase